MRTPRAYCESAPDQIPPHFGERSRRASASMGGGATASNGRDPSWHGWVAGLAYSRLMFQVLAVCLLLGCAEVTSAASKLGKRDFVRLSADAITELVARPDPVRSIDPTNPSSHLSKILIPRPPDTENNTLVREYLVSTLKNLNWHVEEDSFTDMTPYGVKRFTNVIATKDPQASRRVIVAAHFDSKFFSRYPESQVRIDSRPCETVELMALLVVCGCY
jgi:hypothetical protein